MSGPLSRLRSNPYRFIDRFVRQHLVEMLRRLAFWIAVVLPFTYLPLLFAGIDSVGMFLAFISLVSLNVIALIVGHPYGDAR